MKRQFKLCIIAFLCIFLVACEEDQKKKLAKAADDIAIAVDAGIKIKRECAKQGWIDQKQEFFVTKALYDINSAGEMFSAHVKKINQMDTGSKTELIQLMRDINASVAKLNDEILSIKNPEAQAKLKTITFMLGTSMTIVQSLVE
jgi:hypothetical protein